MRGMATAYLDRDKWRRAVANQVSGFHKGQAPAIAWKDDAPTAGGPHKPTRSGWRALASPAPAAQLSSWLPRRVPAQRAHATMNERGADGMDVLIQLNAALAGRYEIEREIGRGGMATVYLARDVRHNRHVALKVLEPRTRRGARRRAVLSRDPGHGEPAASEPAAAVRLGRGGRAAVLRHAVRRGRDAAAPARAREAAAGRRGGAHRDGDRERARLRAPARRDPSRPQAGEHSAADGPAGGRRLRHRARGLAMPAARASRRPDCRSARRST